MKRFFASALIFVLLFSLAFSGAEDNRFTDTETGISFAVPAGWEEIPVTDSNATMKAQYKPSDCVELTTVAFTDLDLYAAANMSQYGATREQVDFSVLSDEIIVSMLGPLEVESNEVKKFGDYQYKVAATTLEKTYNGMELPVHCEMAVTLVNGYVILFQYMETSHSEEYHAAFENILASLRF